MIKEKSQKNNFLNKNKKQNIFADFQEQPVLKDKDKEYQELYDFHFYPELPFHYEECSKNFNFWEHTIYINEEITYEMAQIIFDKIRLWNKIYDYQKSEKLPIKIYINSEGGNLDAAFLIISAIITSTLPVYTYNIGMAYSAAFLILISGHKKFGFPLSSYLFHEGSSEGGADAHKLIQQIDFYKKQLKKMKNFIIENTNITPQLYEKKEKDDWWFDENEALENGIIDKIIKSIIE